MFDKDMNPIPVTTTIKPNESQGRNETNEQAAPGS